MKPTLDSIQNAIYANGNIFLSSHKAENRLYEARAFVEATSPDKCVAKLRVARSCLVSLRRKQTAALRHIDEAIASAKQ